MLKQSRLLGITVLGMALSPLCATGQPAAPISMGSCGNFSSIENEMQKTFDEMGVKLKKEAKEAQDRAKSIKDHAPAGGAVVFDFRVDWKDHEISLNLPSITVKNQEWILRLPEVTSHEQHIIFDLPVTRNVTEVIAKIPGLKCDGFPIPKCEVTQKDVIATRPIVEMQRQDIVLTIPDFAMRDKKVVVGVPEFSSQLQKIVLRLPEFTLRNVKIESEKAQKDADQLVSDTGVATKSIVAEAKQRLLTTSVPKINIYFECIRMGITDTRKAVADQYAIAEAQFRRSIAEAQGHGAADAANSLQASLSKMFIDRDAQLAKIDGEISEINVTQQTVLKQIGEIGN